MKTPGHLVREAREAMGWSQAELALNANIDPTLVSKIERDKATITRPVYKALITALRPLQPADLLNALDWPVTVSGADRLPRGLVLDLLSLSPEELAALALLVRRAAESGRVLQGSGHR